MLSNRFFKGEKFIPNPQKSYVAFVPRKTIFFPNLKIEKDCWYISEEKYFDILKDYLCDKNSFKDFANIIIKDYQLTDLVNFLNIQEEEVTKKKLDEKGILKDIVITREVYREKTYFSDQGVTYEKNAILEIIQKKELPLKNFLTEKIIKELAEHKIINHLINYFEFEKIADDESLDLKKCFSNFEQTSADWKETSSIVAEIKAHKKMQTGTSVMVGIFIMALIGLVLLGIEVFSVYTPLSPKWNDPDFAIRWKARISLILPIVPTALLVAFLYLTYIAFIRDSSPNAIAKQAIDDQAIVINEEFLDSQHEEAKEGNSDHINQEKENKIKDKEKEEEEEIICQPGMSH